MRAIARRMLCIIVLAFTGCAAATPRPQFAPMAGGGNDGGGEAGGGGGGMGM